MYDFGYVVDGADLMSFVVLGKDYAKDAHMVYYSSASEYEGVYAPIRSADPATFTVIDGHYEYDAQDKNQKYLKGQ